MRRNLTNLSNVKKRNLVITERKISFAARVIGLLPFFAILMSAISLKMAFDNRAVQREGIEFTIEDVEIVGDKYPLSLSITGRIVNISDVDVAVRRLKSMNTSYPEMFPNGLGNGKVRIDPVFTVNGVEHFGNTWSGAGLFLKIGGALEYSYVIRLATIQEVIDFSNNNSFEGRDDFLRRLCRERTIDYHGDQLNEAQVSLCPAFHLFSSIYNSHFSEVSGVAQDVFWFEIEAYRGNSFRSHKYKPELGGSVL